MISDNTPTNTNVPKMDPRSLRSFPSMVEILWISRPSGTLQGGSLQNRTDIIN